MVSLAQICLVNKNWRVFNLPSAGRETFVEFIRDRKICFAREEKLETRVSFNCVLSGKENTRPDLQCEQFASGNDEFILEAYFSRSK